MSEHRDKSWLVAGGCFILYSCLVIGMWLTAKASYYFHYHNHFGVLVVISLWMGWLIEYQLSNTGSDRSLTAPTIWGATYMLPIIAGIEARFVEWTLWLSMLIYAILLSRVVWRALNLKRGEMNQ